MKELFRISKEELNLTASTLCNIASEKSPEIQHSFIKIKTGTNLQFICKNFEAYICKQYPYSSIESDFIVGIGIFSNLVKKLESEEIIFFQKEDKLVILDGKAQFTLDTVKTAYTEREKSGFKPLCSIEGKYLSEKIQLCLLKLEGGIFSFNFGGSSYFVARDNRKLSVIDLNINTEEMAINLSPNIVNEIKDVCQRQDIIEIHYSDREILFQLQDYFLICKNHWAKTIDYLELCKSDFFTEIKLKTNPFLKTLKKLKLMASSLTNAMDLEFSDKGVVVSVFNPSVGHAKEQILESCDVEPTKIKLNIVHLINCLQLIKGPEFSMFVKDSKSKVILKDEACYLIMPLSF